MSKHFSVVTKLLPHQRDKATTNQVCLTQIFTNAESSLRLSALLFDLY